MTYEILATPANIKLARERAGHTQKEAAAVIGWTLHRWSKAETGLKKPRDFSMPVELFRFYLYETDQHPEWVRTPRREKLFPAFEHGAAASAPAPQPAARAAPAKKAPAKKASRKPVKEPA